MIKDLLLYFALLLWFVVPSQAQPTIFAADVTGSRNEVVDVFISVEHFTDVVALQYTFEWDSLVLEYIGVKGFNLVDLDGANFGPAEKVNFLISTWFENQLSPVSVPDGDTIFSIQFKVIGEGTETSMLYFSGSELPNIASVDGEQVPLETRMATFTVLGSTNATTLVPANFDLTISPNPFHTSTQIKFNLDKSYDDFQFALYSIDGKLIYKQVYDLPAGEHSLEVAAEKLPAAGMYFLQLSSADLHTTQKIFFENY